MIMNVKACRFDPARLQCSEGKADACLSAAQVTAMRAAFAGP
jgi:feruloyl esterase